MDKWQIWLDPDSAGALIPEVDFIGLDVYPYWQNASASDANAFMDGFNSVRSDPAKENADKDGTPMPVWMTETGFPNDGRREAMLCLVRRMLECIGKGWVARTFSTGLLHGGIFFRMDLQQLINPVLVSSIRPLIQQLDLIYLVEHQISTCIR